MVEKSLLVMENLFYDCDIKNKFDLKGSERNRLVDPTDQQGEIVLLDENLVQSKYYFVHNLASMEEPSLNVIERSMSTFFIQRVLIQNYRVEYSATWHNNLKVVSFTLRLRPFRATLFS